MVSKTGPRLGADPRQSSGARLYQLICLAGLLLVTLCLVEAGAEEWSLLPLLLGALTMLTGWRAGPIIVLGCTFFLILARGKGYDPLSLVVRVLGGRAYRRGPSARGPSPLNDILVCVGMLTYLISQYRFLGLTGQILPSSSRDIRPWWGYSSVDKKSKKEEHDLRPGDPLVPGEVFSLALITLVCPVLAGILWLLVTASATRGLLTRSQSRNVLLVWLLGTILALTWAVIAYWGQRGTSKEESSLYLQDQLWEATRWDQSRINRWLVWARLRRQRKKEKS